MLAREPIRIHPEVRSELRDLLMGDHFEGTGVSYTALVKAAVDLAHGNREFREKLKATQFTVSQLDRRA